MEARAQPPRPRFWVTLQPTIVRIYKIAGLVALTAILVGLVSFLVVNVFYFFDHSWVRPVILSPSHHKVVEASTTLADAELRTSQFVTEKAEIEASLLEIERTITANDKFIVELGAQVDAPKSTEQWMLRRELEKAKLEKENAVGRRQPLGQRLESIKLRISEQEAVVKRLKDSPYLRGIDQRAVLAFVPYENIRRNIKLGTPLYGCAWGLVGCSKVGKVTRVLEGEVENTHPHDETIQRGQMVEIHLTDASAAGDKVLFAGGKPLWLF
ncbi:MAG: hypothetical protein WKG01_24055 [Kofleriaceae bacterium]